MRVNASERRLIICTAACLLFCFGCFFGTNQYSRGVRIDSSLSMQESQIVEVAPSNDQLLLQQSQKEGLVDLNRAGLEELMSLPGIGEVLAGRILEYRAQYGDFHSVQELTKVEGIGEKTLMKLLNYITVEIGRASCRERV